MNHKLETMIGENFNQVAEKAKQIAKEKNCIVEFDFNGITCLVSDKTVLEWLHRDYSNAHIMKWKIVGHECKMVYDYDTEIELLSRQLAQAKRFKKEAEQRRKEEKNNERTLAKQLRGIALEIIPEKIKEYVKYVNKNKDGYGKAVIDYSEAWAKLMQMQIAKGKTIAQCAEETQKPLDFFGITGFQYGCVVKGLAYFWKHGEELRKWHNKEYGVPETEKGVVNPAILTIGG